MEKIFYYVTYVFYFYTLSSSMVYLDYAFFVIDLVVSKFKHWPLFITTLISYIALIFFFDPGLTIGLFSSINPALYNSLGIWQLIGVSLDINVMRSIFQTIFVGVAIYYIYYYFPKNNNEN